MNGCWNCEMSLPFEFMFLLSAEPELSAWLVRDFMLFLSAGSSGTRLFNSFRIAKDVCCTSQLTKLPLEQMCSAVKIMRRVYSSSFTDQLLMISDDKWESVEINAKILGVSACRSSPCSTDTDAVQILEH